MESGNSVLLSLAYTYLPNGQLHSVAEGDGTEVYGYDALGRLTNVTASLRSLWSEQYSYDIYGNKLSVAATGNAPNGSPMPLDGLAGSPTPPNKLAALTYDQKTNRITTPGFTYYAGGNQTRAQRRDGSWVKYRYDQTNRLAMVSDDSGTPLQQYKYATDGRRLQTIDSTGTTSYVWDGTNVIAEYTQPNTEKTWVWSKAYAYLNGRILATVVPDKTSEYVSFSHPDRLGVRLITDNLDGSGNEQVTLPFGTLIPNGSTDPINPVFTSYDRDFVTGLDYATMRDYDHDQRFIQADPAGMLAVRLTNPQSLNLYTYVSNDPINKTDGLGLDDTVKKCSDTVKEDCIDSSGAYVGPTEIVTPDIGFLNGQLVPPGSTGPGSIPRDDSGDGPGLTPRGPGKPCFAQAEPHSMLPHGVGGWVGAQAEGGVLVGSSAQVSAGSGLYWGGERGINSGSYAAGGAFAGSAATETAFQNMTDLVVGAALGAGGGTYITNATSNVGLKGAFRTINVSVLIYSAQIAMSEDIYQVSFGIAKGVGFSYSTYSTNTFYISDTVSVQCK
jgi:RHS repeat-associated protein